MPISSPNSLGAWVVDSFIFESPFCLMAVKLFANKNTLPRSERVDSQLPTLHYVGSIHLATPIIPRPRCRHLGAYMERTSPCFRGLFLPLRACKILPRVNVPPPRLWLKGAVLRVDYVGSIHFTNLLKSSQFSLFLTLSLCYYIWYEFIALKGFLSYPRPVMA